MLPDWLLCSFAYGALQIWLLLLLLLLFHVAGLLDARSSKTVFNIGILYTALLADLTPDLDSGGLSQLYTIAGENRGTAAYHLKLSFQA